MPSLKAWEQGSRAPAHRQVVQGSVPHRGCKGREARIADLVPTKAQRGELSQRHPALNRLGESGEASVRNLVVMERKLLHMAHQTKRLSQKGVYAKSQGMGTRQWGASTPSSGPGLPSPARL